MKQGISNGEQAVIFLEKTENHDTFSCGKHLVSMAFCEDGQTLERILENYFIHMKQGQ